MLHMTLKTMLSAAAAVSMVITITPGARAQAQRTINTAPQLSDAQVNALLQALAAQSKTPNGTSLTPAQAQVLMQYLARQSQSAGTVSAAQSQLMLQALAAQQGTPSPGLPQTAGAPPLTAAGPKKPGTARIGIVLPRAQMGQGNSGANVAEPIRATIMQYLSGPAVEIVPLAAMIPQQIEAEARQKECDYVLYANVTQKVNSGGMGFLKKAAPFTSMVPMVGMLGAAGSAAGAMAGMAASTAMSSAASVAGTVKAKSEVSLEFKLAAPGSATAVVGATLRAKAKEDGEDVITPLIEQADTAILNELAKRK